MGTCSATSQRQYLEKSGKIISNIQNETTQYQEMSSEQTTNRAIAAAPNQPQQANGDHMIYISNQFQSSQQQQPSGQQAQQQLQQLQQQQQPMQQQYQNEFDVQNVQPNLCNKKIKELLEIADEFGLIILKNSLIKMIHTECEKYRNFLSLENTVFEDFIKMYIQQQLEYLNYNQQEIALIQDINNELQQADKIRSNNKFIGERQLQQIKSKIRQECLLNEMIKLEYTKSDEKQVKSEILKAIDQQINQDNDGKLEGSFQNLKKLLFVKQFFACLIKGEAFTIDLKDINVEAQMVNF